METTLTWSRRQLLGFAFASAIEASSAEDFVASLHKYAGDAPGAPQLGDWLRSCQDFIHGQASSSRAALTKLLVTDSARVASVASIYALSQDQLEAELRTDLEHFTDAYGRAGFTPCDVPLHFVDEFPSPFNGQNSWAITVDRTDAAEFRINEGIYLLRRHLMPIASSVILAHELVHAILSVQPSQRFVRGLEEGIADLVSVLALRTKFSTEVIRNTLRNFRFYHPLEPIGHMYADALSAASGLALHLGSDTFVAWVRTIQESGRDAILPDAEISLLQCAAVPRVVADNAPRFQELESVALFLMAYPRGYVVSPNARLVAEHCRVGRTINDVAELSGLPRTATKKALAELEEALRIVMVSENGRLLSADTDIYVKSGVLRYRAV